MSLPFKIHELLDARQLEALEAFAREPGRTVDELAGWMKERGHELSRTAVWNWKRSFDEQRMRERFSRSAELATAIRDAAKTGGAVQISEAAMLQLSQVIFEQAAKLQADGEVDSQDILRLTASIKSLMDSTQRANAIRADFETREKAAVDAASKAAEGGASGEEIVARMREALGVAA
jgi:hypothetical protein